MGWLGDAVSLSMPRLGDFRRVSAGLSTSLHSVWGALCDLSVVPVPALAFMQDMPSEPRTFSASFAPLNMFYLCVLRGPCVSSSRATISRSAFMGRHAAAAPVVASKATVRMQQLPVFTQAMDEFKKEYPDFAKRGWGATVKAEVRVAEGHYLRGKSGWDEQADASVWVLWAGGNTQCAVGGLSGSGSLAVLAVRHRGVRILTCCFPISFSCHGPWLLLGALVDLPLSPRHCILQRWNGRHVMAGWVILVATGYAKGHGLIPEASSLLDLKQWGTLAALGNQQPISNERAIILIAHVHLLFVSVAAALAPFPFQDKLLLAPGEEDDAPAGLIPPMAPGLNKTAETWNGRVAMLGLLVLVCTSVATKTPILDTLNAGLGNLLF